MYDPDNNKSFGDTMWRRRNLVIGITLLICLLGLTIASLQRNIYVARAYFVSQTMSPQFLNAIHNVNENAVTKNALSKMPPELFPFSSGNKQNINQQIQERLNAITDAILGRITYDQRASAYIRQNLVITDHEPGVVSIRMLSTDPSLSLAMADRVVEAYRAALGERFAFTSMAGNETSVSTLRDKLIKDAPTANKEIVYIKKAILTPKEPVRPNLLFILQICIALGLFAGMCAALTAEHLYRTRLA